MVHSVGVRGLQGVQDTAGGNVHPLSFEKNLPAIPIKSGRDLAAIVVVATRAACVRTLPVSIRVMGPALVGVADDHEADAGGEHEANRPDSMNLMHARLLSNADERLHRGQVRGAKKTPKGLIAAQEVCLLKDEWLSYQ